MSKLASVFRPKKDVDMTSGPIAPHLIRFAIPLLLGNIFQQLYNTVDTWVVGNYVSKEAFAAVGTVGPIINMLIGFFLGLSNGAGVVISQYYGAKNYKKVSSVVHSFLLFTVVLGAIFTAVGIVMTPYMLRLTQTPESVMPQSSAYLTIYFSGVIGLMLYNAGTGVLNAVGNSRLPFLFLVCSAVINTVLDLVFVLVLGMGVEGVAYATVIAQLVSATLTMTALIRSDSCIKLIPSKLKLHWDVLKQVLRVGIPAAVQMTITSFSNVFVQAYINHFGDNCMAGWTAYGKVDQFIFMPVQSLALAITTFVGQNMGVGQVKRAKRGANIALLMALISTAAVILPIMLAASEITAFFNDDPAVVEIGSMFLFWFAPFNLVCCVNQIYIGSLRGAGNSKVPMIITLSSFVAFRQIYMFIVKNFISNTPFLIGFGYPAGWLVCSIITLIYYINVPLDKKQLIKNED